MVTEVMEGSLSYRGPVDLTLVYSDGRQAHRSAAELVISRAAADAPVAVLLDAALGFALLSLFDPHRAHLGLPNGTVLAGEVSVVSADYFEMIVDGP